ncbi:unnamed protein product [Caenorhabditis angaria]|uniref:Piwi domain-containing protein n=1 Tax=Caenorhabditis angaria TaxID=860376 RepID=A0A9P1MWQ2_9PELO|nr:unnamed protein product [Caenorhabditis angaria]
MDLLDSIMGTMGEAKPKTSSSDQPTTSAQPYRIKKKTPLNIAESSASRIPSTFKRSPLDSGSGLGAPNVKRDKTMATFKNIKHCDVQTNSYKVILDGLPEVIEQFQFDVYATFSTKDSTKQAKTIPINEKIVVHGDLPIQYRRWGLWNIWKLSVKSNPDLFTKPISYQDGAYDCGAAIYFPAGLYKGEESEHIFLHRSEFEEKIWQPISKLASGQIETIKVMISRTKAKKIYTRGIDSTRPESVTELVRFLEVLTSQKTSSRDFFQFGNSTYTRSSDKNNGILDERCQINQEGKEIKTGFEKTMRYITGTDGKPEFIMTIDVRRSPFNQEMDVIDMVRILYQSRRGGRQQGSPSVDDMNDILYQMQRDGETQMNRKLSELKSMAVFPVHLPNNRMNLFYINGFTQESAEQFTFPADDSKMEISVYDYFLEKYQIRLKYPRLPLAFQKRGKRIICYPLEVLKIERGQRVKQNNVTSSVQSIMTSKLSMLPLEQISRAERVLDEYLSIDDNKFLQAFGLQIKRESTKLSAHILPAPVINFGNGAFTPITGGQRPPLIEARSKVFSSPAKLNGVIVINFDEVLQKERITSMITKLKKELQNQKLPKIETIDWKIENCAEADQRKLESIMVDAKRRNISLIFAITRDQRPEVHDVLKLLESQIGIQTQQICLATFEQLSKGARTTTENVIRKLNLKCGGLNFKFSIPRSENSKEICSNANQVQQKLFGNTLFIGFELSHSGADCLFDRQNNITSGEPSVVGYSYSYGDPCELGGGSYLQKSREHSLMFLSDHMAEILSNYLKARNKLPENIVVYRSGVGEGGFEQIEKEVEQMKSVFKTDTRFKGRTIPPFLMIVVSKTTHMRIYPKEIIGGKAIEQNVPSGTCISSVLTSYGRDEFYLVSQSALIGTIRPARYSVIVNDPKWTVNEISHMTYFLAFGHQVSYQAPGVPNVLYAAGNMAKRGRNNFITYQKLLRREGRSIDRQEMKPDENGELLKALTEELNKCTISCKMFWA